MFSRILTSLLGFAVTLLITAPASLSTHQPSTLPSPTTPYLAPIYVPSQIVEFDVPCGGGTHLLSFDYFPSPGDTTYELRMMASGGTYGGSVTLSLPWGYEESAYVAALSGTNPYTITVTTPPYTGINPVRVEVFGTGEVCVPQKADHNAAVTPLTVNALNIKAGH